MIDANQLSTTPARSSAEEGSESGRNRSFPSADRHPETMKMTPHPNSPSPLPSPLGRGKRGKGVGVRGHFHGFWAPVS